MKLILEQDGSKDNWEHQEQDFIKMMAWSRSDAATVLAIVEQTEWWTGCREQLRTLERKLCNIKQYYELSIPQTDKWRNSPPASLRSTYPVSKKSTTASLWQTFIKEYRKGPQDAEGEKWEEQRTSTSILNQMPFPLFPSPSEEMPLPIASLWFCLPRLLRILKIFCLHVRESS